MLRSVLTLILLTTLTATLCAADLPHVVVQSADDFAHRSMGRQLPPREVMLGEYSKNFFSGFTHPWGGVITKSALIQDAYTRGQAYWHEHPEDRGNIFAAYGYTAVERDGVWSRGFEKSTFEPVGATRATWWMSSFGGRPWSEAGLDPGLGRGRVPVHIEGYLSPNGRYGHLGTYERELLVITGQSVAAAD